MRSTARAFEVETGRRRAGKRRRARVRDTVMRARPRRCQTRRRPVRVVIFPLPYRVAARFKVMTRTYDSPGWLDVIVPTTVGVPSRTLISVEMPVS